MQAGMQVIGNGGDIGAALQALASIDTVRMLATTMLTAGLTHGLMDAANLGGDSALLSQAGDMSQTLDILTAELQRAAIRGGVSAGVDTAINGGDIGQNLAFQMQAAGVAVLGKQGARAIGTAFKDQQIDTATKYIAHAALGGAMDIAMGGDGTSGALGAVTGEFIADSYVNAWIGDKLADPASMNKLEGDALKAELKKLEGEIAELRRKGVDVARLGAGMAAALTGGDINAAAQTGGNAAEHNALPLLLVIYGACEAVDAGIKLYNAYKLAEAIQNQDEEAILQYGSEIVVDSAIGAVPLSGVFTKLGMTKVGAMVLALGTKMGDGAASVLTKIDDIAKYAVSKGKLPDNYITKAEAIKLGWNPSKGNLHEVAPGKSIGGDKFYNDKKLLPDAPGREWIEADINYSKGYRGSERLVISNDGLVYKTTDHYKTFLRVK